MPKLSPRADRILFFGVCCLIGIFSIGFWFFVVSGFRKSPTMSASATVEIPVNETIRAVWDSGLYRERVVAAGIYWVDNGTILVSANKGPKPQTSEEMRAAEDWLYLWRLGEKPRPYGADPRAAARSYCAARGEVAFYQEIVDPRTGAVSRTRWVGPPGRERQAEPLTPPLDKKAAGLAVNPLTVEKTNCEIIADPAMAGTFYVTDSDRSFYLDFGNDPIMAAVDAKSVQPIILMRADGSGRVELPISNAQAAPGETHFHTFDKVFYLWNGNLGVSPINHFAIWRETNCWPIWRIDPRTAKTERLCIPFGPWSGAMHGGASTSIELAPTKAGPFFATHPIKAEEEHGFYRLDGSSAVSRILPGYVWSPSVSPDGCRIAFIHIPNDDADRAFSPVSSSIVVIDVCLPRPNAPSSAN
jgi:hypothetical protein